MKDNRYVKTNEEREALDAALRTLREEWGFASSYGLGGLVKSWRRCVKEIERRKGVESYDLEHDLSLRDELDTLVDAVPAALAARIRSVLDPLDARFVASTRLTDKPILPALDGEVLHERWYREPLVGR